jgi:IclR family KDG regulon transcriptional repressor
MERIPLDGTTRAVEREPVAATNRAVERACALMSSFAPGETRLTLRELALRARLPKPTTHRIVTTLVAAGFMTQAQDGGYSLGFRLLSLGAIVRDGLDVVRVCAPAMERLAKATSETVILGEADWAAREVTIVHRVDSSHTLSVLSPIGRRSAIPPGALGKALLIGLPPEEAEAVIAALPLNAQTDRTHTDRAALVDEIARYRELGYVVEEGEYLRDVSGVAAPVLLEGTRPLAALGLVGPSTRLREQIPRLGALVRAVAAELST